jgi:pyridoxal phosphate enzyme (YggS family)
VSILDNVEQVRQRIHAACLRVGRNPTEVSLIAVSKTFPPQAIREAYAAGLRRFGESRIQEFTAKAEGLRDLRAEWHMIGHLQTNKAVKAAELFSAIDSVDSLRLAERLNSAAKQFGKQLPVLIEINVGGESAKSGLRPQSPELDKLLRAAPGLEHLAIGGLMTVPPFADEAEQTRLYFCKLRENRDQIAARGLPSISMRVLSMGMSHDFEVAIEEGSTCVRVGTAIFGHRRSNEIP